MRGEISRRAREGPCARDESTAPALRPSAARVSASAPPGPPSASAVRWTDQCDVQKGRMLAGCWLVWVDGENGVMALAAGWQCSCTAACMHASSSRGISTTYTIHAQTNPQVARRPPVVGVCIDCVGFSRALKCRRVRGVACDLRRTAAGQRGTLRSCPCVCGACVFIARLLLHVHMCTRAPQPRAEARSSFFYPV